MPITDNEMKELKSVFLPFGPNRVAARPMPPQQLNREAPERRRRHRELGEWAYRVVDGIRDDYLRQIDKVWKPAIGIVFAAFATAISNQEKVKKLAEQEREERAAMVSLMLGLIGAGAMSFLGAYVEHVFMHRFKTVQTHKDYKGWFAKIAWSGDIGDGPRVLSVTTKPRFSDYQRAAFGNFASGVGDKLIELAYPTPQPMGKEFDWSTPFVLRERMHAHMDGAANVILERLDEVKKWLNSPDPEFGEIWCAFSGTTERARVEIVPHFTALRDDWARRWLFYGTNPALVNEPLLAETFERTLWAVYVLNTKVSYTPTGKHSSVAVGKDIENAVVNRLKELNVVWAETGKGHWEQMQRIPSGAPTPMTIVDGTIDTRDEVTGLDNWAKEHLKSVPADISKRLVPPGWPRQLPPLVR